MYLITEIYINLDSVRGKEFFDQIKFELNVNKDSNNIKNRYRKLYKIDFLRPSGSGKTTELQRLHHQINKPLAYYSIFIELRRKRRLFPNLKLKTYMYL